MRTGSLKSTITMLTIATTLLAVLVAAALMLAATALRRTTMRAGDSVEGIHLVDQAQNDLLLHARAQDPLSKEAFGSDLRRKLARARHHMTSAAEQRALDRAIDRVDTYLASGPASSLIETATLQSEAYSALESLVGSALEESRKAIAAATRWRYISNSLGLFVVAAVLGTTAWLLVWLRRRAFKPVLALGDAMKRFGRGERNVRAAETGHAELREMSARFNDMASALEEQHRSQLAMLGGVAHDLRTPLSALKMSLELIGDGRMLEVARRQVVRLERMVGDLLGVARVEAGQLELQRAAEDLRSVIRDVIEALPRDQRERVHVMLPVEPVCALVDRGRMEQAVGNLVSNALKYSAADSPVEVDLSVQGSEAILSVADRGIGISEEDQQRLFEPFRRFDVDHSPGVGLGLFVTHGIVEGHGGKIGVASQLGRGTTFTVRLPVHEHCGEPLRSSSTATTSRPGVP